jgi:hypothetical protein
MEKKLSRFNASRTIANSDTTVLMESSDENEEGSLQAKKALEVGPFVEAMMGGSGDPMATLTIQAVCTHFPMMVVMKRVKTQFKRIVEGWDFEGDLTKQFRKDAKSAVRRIMDVEEVENVIVDEIVARMKWESLKARAISRILQNDVEAHPMLDLLGDRHWKFLPEADTRKDVDHDDGDGNGVGSEA